MKKILSIQSHVSNSFVGNKVASFCCQLLGHNISEIHTVQYSNHTGYTKVTGNKNSAKHIENIVSGMKNNNNFYTHDAVLTGYLGDEDLISEIKKIVCDLKNHNPNLIYLCDPVFGDYGASYSLVSNELKNMYLSELLPLADIATPNCYELEKLTNLSINNLGDAYYASQKLISHGVKSVLTTSIKVNSDLDNIYMMFTSNDDCLVIKTKKISTNSQVSGTGDATAAIFLSHVLNNHNIDISLNNTANALFDIFYTTFAGDYNIESKSKDIKEIREIKLVESQNKIRTPSQEFNCVRFKI